MTGALFAATAVSCATVPKRVVRDTQTYTAEILASLAREQAAAESLVAAAAAARTAGDIDACRAYYAPAYLIEVKAQRQAYRALWLAGVPYPLPDGTVPDPKVEQKDPGPPPVVDGEAIAAFCADVVLEGSP